MEWPEEILEFHLWYLKGKKWIVMNDSGAYTITVQGVEELESDGSVIRRDRLLAQLTESSKKDDNGAKLIETDPPNILDSPE